MYSLSLTFKILEYFTVITFILTSLEFLYSYYKRDSIHSIKNTISNTSNGLFYELLLNNIVYLAYIGAMIFLSKYLGFLSVNSHFTLLEFILCLILCDFTFYVYHVVHHKINFFWMFHFVHHSDDKLNLATNYRFSIIEKLYSSIMFVVPVFFGFNPYLAVLCFYLLSIYQFVNHSPYIKIPKILEYVFITPQLHGIHHDQEIQNKNFGALFSIWDRFFGTYKSDVDKISPGIKNYSQADVVMMQTDPIITFVKNVYFKVWRQ